MSYRDIGLEIGLNLSRLMTGREHLHYGLWEPEVSVCTANLLRAQEAYTDKLLAMLPKRDSLHVFDIGGGAGETARRLVDMGHTVDVVVPSPLLHERCRQNLGNRAAIHLARFEDFNCSKQFDVCLFSESLQYINLESGLRKASELVMPSGVILVADCFRKRSSHRNTRGFRPVGGGYPLDVVRKELERNELVISVEHDITMDVAPSIKLEQEFYSFLGDSFRRIDQTYKLRHPVNRWFIGKMFKMVAGSRRLNEIERRIFGPDRNMEEFCKYNTYLMMKIVNNSQHSLADIPV